MGTWITAELAAVVATMLAVGASAPQLRRLLRTGDIAGVSVSCAMLGAGTESAWVAYAVDGELWMAVPEAVLMLVANVVLARALIRAGAVCRRAAIAAAAWSATITVVVLVGGVAALASVLAIGYAVQSAPSVWTAYRTVVPSGIAVTTWALIGVEGTLWGVYGLSHGDPATTSLAAISISAAIAIVLRARSTRHRAAPLPASSTAPSSASATSRAADPVQRAQVGV